MTCRGANEEGMAAGSASCVRLREAGPSARGGATEATVPPQRSSDWVRWIGTYLLITLMIGTCLS